MIDRTDLYMALAKDFSLIPLQHESKKPVEPNWIRWCAEKRRFDYSDFISEPGQPINAGITCGPASGVVVFNIKDVGELQNWLDEKGIADALPETYSVNTSNNSFHYYYKYPKDGNEYKSRKVNRNCTILGMGAYAVAPGSIHPKTKESYRISRSIPIADLPEWAREYLLERDTLDSTKDDETGNRLSCLIKPAIEPCDESSIRNFKEGDVVQLKSGGPRMTVSEVLENCEEEFEYTCCWFDDNKFVHRIFIPEVLRVAGIDLVENEYSGY